MASIEDQLAELKQQVVEERESRAAAEKAAADRAEAQQKRHEETLKKQHVETMPSLWRNRADKRSRSSGMNWCTRRQSRVTRSRIRRHQHRKICIALMIVLYTLRLPPERTNLARAGKIETMVSTVSPQIHTKVEDPPYPR